MMHTVINAYARSVGPTDPSFANTVLLLSGDGANGSTTFTDESFAARGNGNVSGVSNQAQVETSNKKFGTGSIHFDGSADDITFADSADFHFGSSAFTIDAWANFDTASIAGDEQVVIAQWDSAGGRSWMLVYEGHLATNRLVFYGSSAGSAVNLTVPFNWTPTASQWYHLAVDRSGNDFRLYIDGTMVAKVTQSITLFDSPNSLRIGDRNNAGSVGWFHGNLDEIRITKGVARYGSDSGFAVPTAAYPRS